MCSPHFRLSKYLPVDIVAPLSFHATVFKARVRGVHGMGSRKVVSFLARQRGSRARPETAKSTRTSLLSWQVAKASARVLCQGYHRIIFFRVRTRSRGMCRRVAHTHAREWEVTRYSRHRITRGIREYYSYFRIWRSRYS